MSAQPAPRSRGRPGSTRPDAAEPSVSVLEQVFSRRGRGAARRFARRDQVATWAGTVGTLVDGRMAHLAASCLMRPCAGRPRARVAGGVSARRARGARGRRLDRRHHRSERRTPHRYWPARRRWRSRTPCLGVSAGAVHIAARDFLTSTRNRHAVEDTRTETARVRVAEVGTDIRRATTVDDQVAGTLLQRAGTWIANTAREARFKARTFLFD